MTGVAGTHRANDDHSERAAIAPLFAAALGLFAVRLYVAAATGLVDDEAYYRMWSLAPSLSYLDHPPMIAWLIGAGRALVGDSTLGVRFSAPLILLLATPLVWRLADLLYGRRIAQRAAWFMLAMPLLAVGGILVTPDLPSVVFGGLVVLALAELDRSQNANWWLGVGLFAGCGLLSKYTNLFLGATIVLWLLWVPGNRKWFRAPQLWLGGVIAALLASPVVIWNAQHDWASFSKQFGRVGKSGGGGLSYIAEFAGGFLALASPIIAVLAIAGFAHVMRRAFRDRQSNDTLLAAAIVPMLAYFALHALHDRVQGNWPGPLYPLLAITAALGLETIVPAPRQRTTFAAAIGIGFAMIAVIYGHARLPLISVAKDPTEQMRGWPALGDAIDAKRREVGAKWIATSSYATTGQMTYALKGRTEVIQLDQRIRYEFLPPPPPALLSVPALYVELERRVNLDLLKSKFANVTPLGTVKRANGIGEGATYQMYLVSDPPQPPL